MYSGFLKRAFDLTVAVGSLILFSPLMAVIAILIKLEDGGPIFFRQERIGKGGREFEFLKFRSMPVDAANVPSVDAASIKITRIGKFIRRTNIDELPQLFNVLRGEMSIVGPRPAIQSQTGLVSMRAENGVEKCLPGLTGLAQVNAYDGMPEIEKAAFDGEYASSISFIKDLRIIGRTFSYLTRKPPVY